LPLSFLLFGRGPKGERRADVFIPYSPNRRSQRQ
jgi:hypothetical protein